MRSCVVATALKEKHERGQVNSRDLIILYNIKGQELVSLNTLMCFLHLPDNVLNI